MLISSINIIDDANDQYFYFPQDITVDLNVIYYVWELESKIQLMLDSVFSHILFKQLFYNLPLNLTFVSYVIKALI